MAGVKHLIECHCKLRLYRDNKKNIYHKFPVYSLIDKNNKVLKKIVKCNNCETLHSVYDINKSEIFINQEDTTIVKTKDDISFLLPDKIVKILKSYNSSIADYEHALDVIEEKRWKSIIVLKREIIKEIQHVKYIQINSHDQFEIKNEQINDTIILK